ncbi:MAG: hypothetical protein HKN43_08975 [Rhodothermales bacterium]|nr:hypothetical protein [Rhodothermales bacterium]
MFKRLPLIFTFAAMLVGTAFAQNPIWVEGAAGLALPTDSDFRDAYNSGMTLGGRAGYGLSSTIDATGTLKYNRYKFDNAQSIVEATLTSINLMVGGRYKFPSESKLGYEAGSEIGLSRLAIDINNPDIILGKTADSQIRFEGDSSTKFAWSVLGTVTYNVVASTFLFVSPSFNLIFADNNAHHLDFTVGARFLVSGGE